MRLFGGKGLLASGGQVYYDFDDRWIPLIGQRRPRYVDAAVLLTPSGESRPAFDGRDPDCVWHRLLIDARIPSDIEIRISSRAANDPDERPFTDWQREPRLYARRDGSELPFVDEGDYSTWELLLQRATGRYLQLKLEILGSGQHTPSLRALRVYYPRFSYLNHYLPAVYRDDLNSASFLDRFLSNIEGFFTTIEDKIAAVGILFDVHSAPQEALDWLAGWMGIAFDSGWDAARRRLFIKHALFFFSRRGTIPGLTMALQLALDECPEDTIFDSNPNARRIQASGIRIVENYRARRTPGVVLGDPTESSGLRLIPKAQPWLPDEGNSGLQQRYQEFMSARNVKTGIVQSFSTTPPSDAALQKLWQQFAQETLSFVPAVGTDAAQWRSFLTRRYQFVDRYNDSYRLTGAARITRFEDAAFPINIPGDGAPLQDWYQYQAVFLPMQATAHRFTVLLPVKPGYQDPTKQADALDLVNRILNLEKPAHTTFEVRLYWAMFRLGEVRLGFDTLIDRGSRAPELMTPMILGQGHLMESYLAPSHPQDVRDRQVLGRDRLQN
jgi:phage tail-like protein